MLFHVRYPYSPLGFGTGGSSATSGFVEHRQYTYTPVEMSFTAGYPITILGVNFFAIAYHRADIA